MKQAKKQRQFITNELKDVHSFKNADKDYQSKYTSKNQGPRSINYKSMIIFNIIFVLIFIISVIWSLVSLSQNLALQIFGFDMLENLDNFPLFFNKPYVFGFFISFLNLFNVILLWIRSFKLRNDYLRQDALERWKIYYSQSIIRLWQFISFFVGITVIVWIISLYPEITAMAILWIITMINLILFFTWDYFSIKRGEKTLQSKAISQNLETIINNINTEITFNNQVTISNSNNQIDNSKNINIGSIHIDSSTKNLTNTWEKQLNMGSSDNSFPINNLDNENNNLESHNINLENQTQENNFVGVGEPPKDNYKNIL